MSVTIAHTSVSFVENFLRLTKRSGTTTLNVSPSLFLALSVKPTSLVNINKII